MKAYCSVFLLVALIPSALSARYIDTRNLSVEKAKIQTLLNSKRSVGGDDGAQAAAAAAFALGTGLALAGSFGPRYYYRPYHAYPYPYRGYSYYPYGGYYSYSPGYAAASAAGGLLMAVGAAASISAESKRQDAIQNNTSIERQIAGIINTLVQSDEDYIQEASALNRQISSYREQLVGNLDTQAREAFASIEAPSNQMELRLQSDLAALQSQELSAKAYNKALKGLDKAAVKSRKRFAKSLRPQKEAVLQNRAEAFQNFSSEAQAQIEKLGQEYFRLYYAKLI